MRTVALLLLAVVCASTLDVSKFAALVQTGTRANDAVESVYNLLRDLKSENLQVQVAADTKNGTDEEVGGRIIGQFTEVVNINQRNWLQAKANRDSIDDQIRDTYKWLQWAEGRLAEIQRKTDELQDQRCFSNGLFVKSLKDHSDAVEVVKLLKSDISGYLTNKPSSFAEITPTNVAERLSMYSHLFQQDAMKQFMQLAAQETEHMTAKQADTIADQVYEILTSIEAKLNDTLAYLQQQEIAAAIALAKWLSDVGAEKAYLNQEISRKETALEKLNIAQPAALATQAKANAILKESQDALQGSIEDLQEKRGFYLSETARRAEENAIIDTCISIFKDQVRNLVSGTSLKRL